MRSSDDVIRAHRDLDWRGSVRSRAARGWHALQAACCIMLLTACAPKPPADGEASAAAPKAAAVACVVTQEPAAPKDALDGAAFRSAVETGPLFALLSKAGLARCEMRYEAGTVALDYRFNDGASLRAAREAAIEYTEQDVRLAVPLVADPLSVLKPAERAAFAPAGCGIDWGQADTEASTRVPGTQELVFRGTACNCQARVRKDAAGRVMGLLLRSAC